MAQFNRVLVGILCFFVVYTSAEKCGSLAAYPEDTAVGDIAVLHLRPVLPVQHIYWNKIKDERPVLVFDTQTSTVASSSKYQQEQFNGYRLKIHNVTDTDEGYYFATCITTNGSVNSGLGRVKVTSYLLSQSSQDTYCGILVANENKVEEGTAVQLKFQTNTSKTVTWQRQTGTSFEDIVDDRVFDIVPASHFRHFLYILGAEARYTDSGVYRVKCNNTFSNTVTVSIVPKPPSKPEFDDTVNNSFCQNCLPALVGKEVHVVCYTYGGSEPVDLRMLKNKEELKRNLDVNSPKSTGEKRARYVFIPQAEEVNPVFTCTVKNPALAVELVTSITVYTYIPPKIMQISGVAVRENESSVIQCVTQGGRPPLQPFFIVNSSQYSVSLKTDTPTGSTFTVTSSIRGTFNRFENNASVLCCVDILTEKTCTADRLIVTFPSTEIEVREVRKNNSNNGDTYLELECVAGPSNPASKVKWFGAEDGKKHLLNEDIVNDKSTGGTILIAVMSFHLNRKHNGQKISCSAENFEYPDYRVTSTYTLNITYEPIVSIDGPENRTTYVGDTVSLVCRVDSNPVSRIFWKNETTSVIDSYGGRLVLTLDNITMDDEQSYICVARNDIGGFKSKSVNLIVKDASARPPAEQTTDVGSSLIGAVVGITVAVVVGVVVWTAVLTVRKRRRDSRRKKLLDREEKRKSQIQILRESNGEEASAANNEQLYSQVNKTRKKKSPIVDQPEYAKVTPREQRNKDDADADGSNHQKPRNNGGQLIYAELELQTQTHCLNKPVIKQQEATEYVSIDFSKPNRTGSVEYSNS